jgi:hypothetical protein
VVPEDQEPAIPLDEIMRRLLNTPPQKHEQGTTKKTTKTAPRNEASHTGEGIDDTRTGTDTWSYVVELAGIEPAVPASRGPHGHHD